MRTSTFGRQLRGGVLDHATDGGRRGLNLTPRFPLALIGTVAPLEAYAQSGILR